MQISKKAREAAKTLAVAYAEYVRATSDLDVVCWGPILLAAQAELGVALVRTDTVERDLSAARSRRSRRQAGGVGQ